MRVACHPQNFVFLVRDILFLLALNKTYTYTYDAGGNITSKKEYAYTTGALGSVQKTYTYGYRTSGWKDQLLSWNGKSFAYDNAGNPTTYKGESMTWTGGRWLSSYFHNGTKYTFTYDGEGQRKTKTFGDTTVRYVYVDGKLLKELQTVNGEEKEILYQYDETGVIGFLYDGYQYYYRKNAQGDILSVHCGTDLHAMYTYDAWGNCTISFDAAGIGALNPFRYRGYYLDRETGLYYLMTRYYDPEIGRFVNADDVSYLAPETLNGLNLYAYCLNNPVMNSDPEGTFWHLIIGAIVGAVAGAVVSAITQAILDPESLGTPEYFLHIGVAALSGAITGFTAATGVGLLGQIAINAGAGALSGVADTLIDSDENTTILDYVGSALIGGTIGAIAGWLGGKGSSTPHIKSAFKQLQKTGNWRYFISQTKTEIKRASVKAIEAILKGTIPSITYFIMQLTEG